MTALRVSTKPTRSPIACGTYAGYQKHLRSQETPCDDCKAANAAMSRERRRDPREMYLHDKRKRARLRALSRLAKAYPEEYRRLYSEEAAGLR